MIKLIYRSEYIKHKDKRNDVRILGEIVFNMVEHRERNRLLNELSVT